jgi:type II secretory pathway pseudopilin PulG
MTLVEVLIAMSILVVVLLATFAAFDGFGRATRANFKQNHAQSIARSTADRIARELRNTASPGFSGAPIERATSNDLIFNRVEPSGAGGPSNSTKVARVRYCLVPSERKIWRQVETWSVSSRPSLPSTTDCPGSPFGTETLVADVIVNGHGRPLFAYDSTTLANITSVELDIYADVDLNQAPGEQRLTTEVFLRNQNRAPIAEFTATTTGNRHVLLNASASSDPDGDTVTYSWYDGGTLVGDGPLLDYAAPSTGNRTLQLSVTDPAGLTTLSPTQTINVQ